MSEDIVDDEILTAMMLLEMGLDGLHPEYGTLDDYVCAAHSFLQVARGGNHPCEKAASMAALIINDSNNFKS